MVEMFVLAVPWDAAGCCLFHRKGDLKGEESHALFCPILLLWRFWGSTWSSFWSARTEKMNLVWENWSLVLKSPSLHSSDIFTHITEKLSVLLCYKTCWLWWNRNLTLGLVQAVVIIESLRCFYVWHQKVHMEARVMCLQLYRSHYFQVLAFG